MKETILNLFFNNNIPPKKICEQLHITKGYVSQIVSKDSRYKEYKENKLKNSKKRHNQQIQAKTK